MSTNCIVCVKNKRTGIDLLCDECRDAKAATFASDTPRTFDDDGSDLRFEPKPMSDTPRTDAAQGSDGPIVLADFARTLERELNAVRVCFAEASHNAGPAFVAHERLAQVERELAAVTKQRDDALVVATRRTQERDKVITILRDLAAATGQPDATARHLSKESGIPARGSSEWSESYDD